VYIFCIDHNKAVTGPRCYVVSRIFLVGGLAVVVGLGGIEEVFAMDYHSLVEKTTTLRGRLTGKMGSKEIGDEATIQTSTSRYSTVLICNRL